MSESHFMVETVMDRATKQKGKVTINRANGLVTVRPLRSRRAFVLPLNELVTIAVQRSIMQEVAENRKPRKRLVKRGLISLGPK